MLSFSLLLAVSNLLVLRVVRESEIGLEVN